MLNHTLTRSSANPSFPSPRGEVSPRTWPNALVAALALATNLFGYPQAGAGDPTAAYEPMPLEFRASGGKHRVLVARDSDAYGALRARGAIESELDYGSFLLLTVDEQRGGSLDELATLGADVADELTLVGFNGFRLDGADRAGTEARLAELPTDLRAPQTTRSASGRRLRVVQFAGPVRDEWFDALRATGARIVSYAAHNAYVVQTDAGTDPLVEQLGLRSEVLATFEYEPAFKLRPELRASSFELAAFHDVVVQVIADGQGETTAAELEQRAAEVLVPRNRVLGYINLTLRIDGANVHELARDPRVFAIEPRDVPALFDERQGQIMAGNVSAVGAAPTRPGYVNWLRARGLPGPATFPFVVDLTDDGIDRGSTTDVNNEFRVGGVPGAASRVAYNLNYTSDALADSGNGHGNLDASIVGGCANAAVAGSQDPRHFLYGMGLAPWVQIGGSKIFNNANWANYDPNQSATWRLGAAYARGARISNNSWGSTLYNTYTTDSQEHDWIVRDADFIEPNNAELAIVFAAGNAGSGASSVRSPGTAKNVITVGASENWRTNGADGCNIPDTQADDARDIAPFSSRGPTADGRRKPEIVAPGTHIQAAASRSSAYDGAGVCDQYWPTGQTLYARSSGTSHSAPAVAGAMALVRQYFVNGGSSAPSPAMLKAFLCNAATYLTGVDANDTLWSNNQGMGRLDLKRAFDCKPRILVDQTKLFTSTGQSHVIQGFVVSNQQPFRITLAWTDAPGATPTQAAWVNNLDLEVSLNGTLYRGNVFNGASSTTGGVSDSRNNMESVFLPAGFTGPFAVTVRATSIAGDGVPGNLDSTDQDYALVIYNGQSMPAGGYGMAKTYTSSPWLSVPDNDSVGLTSAIHVPEAIWINGVSVNVDLAHTYQGDLKLTLMAPSGALAVLHDRTGGSTDNLVTTYSIATTPVHPLSVLNNWYASGTWRLLVQDLASIDVGTLRSWSLSFNNTFATAPALAIPDNNSTGVTSSLPVGQSGIVQAMHVRVAITHTYQGDLVVKLIGPDQTSVILHNRTGGSADNIYTEYPELTLPAQSLQAFTGKSVNGTWKLQVTDLAGADVGTLDSWSMTVDVQ